MAEQEDAESMGPPSYLAAAADDDDDNLDDINPLDPTQDLINARRAVSSLNASTQATRKSLQDAREKLLASKFDKTAALLAISQGLSQPTFNGGFAGFAQSLGNMSGALQKPVADKREFERQKLKDLLGIDQSMYGLDEKTAESAIKLAQIRARLTQLSKAPAALQIWDAYQKMDPTQRVAFLETMRNPNVQVRENEGVQTVIDPRAYTHPNVPGVVAQRPLTTIDAEAAAQRQLAESKEAGKTTGEKVAGAQFNLPRAISDAEYMKDLIKRLRDHEGLPYAVGATSVLPIVPGSNAADFQSMLKQVGGKTFLQAYESLRGTGQITEIEGTQAKEAISRMQTAQSEKAFKEAADEFLGIVDRATGVLKQQARMGTGAGAGLPSVRSDDDYAKLKPGTVFLDPSGKRRKKPGG